MVLERDGLHLGLLDGGSLFRFAQYSPLGLVLKRDRRSYFVQADEHFGTRR